MAVVCRGVRVDFDNAAHVGRSFALVVVVLVLAVAVAPDSPYLIDARSS